METTLGNEGLSNMDLLTSLELQIESLLAHHSKLSQENDSLRDKLTKATQDRAKLQGKTEKAASRIKKLIAQLKDDL